MITTYRKELPFREVLRLSEDGLSYEWSECGVYQSDVTGYYAFVSSAGCSCDSFDEDLDEGLLDRAEWYPTHKEPFIRMMDWTRSLRNQGEKVSKMGKVLSAVIDERVYHSK